MDQHTEGKWLIHGTNAARTISCKAWNSPVEYPSREYKHDIKKSEGNMLNSICQDNVKGWKHPGSCVFNNIILYYDICVSLQPTVSSDTFISPEIYHHFHNILISRTPALHFAGVITCYYLRSHSKIQNLFFIQALSNWDQNTTTCAKTWPFPRLRKQTYIGTMNCEQFPDLLA